MLANKIDIFGMENIIVSVIIAAVISVLLILVAKKIFGAFQQLYYNERKLLKWANKPDNLIFSRLILLSFLIFLSFTVLNLSLSFVGVELASFLGFIAYLLFFVIFIYADTRYALKVSVKNTARLKRLKSTFFAVSFILSLALIIAFTFLANAIHEEVLYVLRFLPLAILPVLVPYLIVLSGIINKVYELPKNKGFVRAAKNKLENAEIIKIGITGSYGKTSVKNILSVILSEKYEVLSTPNSYNTPLGIARTINNNNLNGYQVFIAEMGAKNTGDIKELCDIVKPKYSILTGICPQHLESFKSLENIKKTKFEIVENTDENGKVIFGNADLKELYDKTNVAKYIVGKDIFAENVEISENGSKFTIVYGAESIKCHTMLLGKHNVENILTSSLLALNMGLSLKEVSSGISKIKFEKHRLELLKPENGLFVLDDSFNANVKGVEAALEVLKLFKGKKVVVTPGMVELGILEQKENYSLGQKLNFSDHVVLVGETLVTSIRDGLMSMGYEEDKITLIPELNKIGDILKNIVKAGDVVLFLNDLPDFY